MSFENVYRSREGTREINKIADFVLSLVIKNNYEASAAETSDSVGNYYSYFGAYTKTDTFDDYNQTDKKSYRYYTTIYMKSLNSGYTDEQVLALSQMTNTALKDASNTTTVKDYLKALRVARIYSYNEKNTYYRQFLGIPNSDDEYVNIVNYDAVNVNDDGYIPADTTEDPIKNMEYFVYDNNTYTTVGVLTSFNENLNYFYRLYIYAHEMSESNYPQTYAYYELQNNIESIITEYPNYTYLNFLCSGFSAYSLRNLPNYSIIRYRKNVLSNTELNYFFKSYNKAKSQIVADYINGFDKKQPLYNLLMIENLLYYTILNYSNSYIEKYSLCDYTDENLNDILNSYGYSKLTGISDSNIKARVVANLNDLISNKGNNYILELLLKRIIKSDNSELKRHYIEKKYTVDGDMAVSIDTSKSLENSVSLVFRETSALVDDDTTTEDVYHDYDSFVVDDNEWAGINSDDSITAIENKRNTLKKKILSLNFNSILTKYITLTKTVDILESQRNLRDSLYLMLNYFNENKTKEFFSTKISFDTIEVTPSALFAAMCWLQQMKYYDNPDTIIKDKCLINNTAAFRQFGKVAVCASTFENTFIKNGKVCTSYDITTDLCDWNVKDFLKKDDEISTIQVGNVLRYQKIAADGYKYVSEETENITDYINHYRYYENGIQLGEITSDTTFADLINDYRHQYPALLEHITKRLRDSYDFREYQAWLFLLNQSRLDNSIYFIFNECTTFSEYINSSDSTSLNSWINSAVSSNSYGVNKLERICNVLNIVTNAFKAWVDTSFSTLVYQYSLDDVSDNYVSDMILLFNEFLSAYSELYSVDYKYTLGNQNYDGLYLQLFYNPLNLIFKDSYIEQLLLNYKESSKIKNSDSETLQIEYDGLSDAYDEFTDSIVGDITVDETTKKYIPDDFKYVCNMKSKYKPNDLLSLIYKPYSNESIFIKSETLGLIDSLKITYNKGE